jgi:hypothetical protein
MPADGRRGIIAPVDVSNWLAVLGVALLICTPAIFGSPSLRSWTITRLLHRSDR